MSTFVLDAGALIDLGVSSAKPITSNNDRTPLFCSVPRRPALLADVSRLSMMLGVVSIQSPARVLQASKTT